MIRIMGSFWRKYSSTNCGDVIDYDISVPREHERFIEGGVWRSTCMNQIEFVVNQLYRLADKEVWQKWVKVALSRLLSGQPDPFSLIHKRLLDIPKF